MKTYLKKLFLLTGLLPATILLALTLSFLPSFISDLSFEFDEIVIVVSMLLGICGYIGLTLSLLSKFENNSLLKLTFLILGLIGSITFTSITGGKRAWKWVMNIEEFDEWIIWIWPLIVSIVLIGLNGLKLLRKNKK
jgi:hypothetical protein